jgi:hypothetical protein
MWHEESGSSLLKGDENVVHRLPQMEEEEGEGIDEQQSGGVGVERKQQKRTSFHSYGGGGGSLSSRPLVEGDEETEEELAVAQSPDIVTASAADSTPPSTVAATAMDSHKYQAMDVAPALLTEDFARQRIHFLFPNDSDDGDGGLPADFPKFDKKSFRMGKHLGRGCFSDVEEIVKVRSHALLALILQQKQLTTT